jgi:hypothetical protein
MKLNYNGGLSAVPIAGVKPFEGFDDRVIPEGGYLCYIKVDPANGQLQIGTEPTKAAIDRVPGKENDQRFIIDAVSLEPGFEGQEIKLEIYLPTFGLNPSTPGLDKDQLRTVEINLGKFSGALQGVGYTQDWINQQTNGVAIHSSVFGNTPLRGLGQQWAQAGKIRPDQINLIVLKIEHDDRKEADPKFSKHPYLCNGALRHFVNQEVKGGDPTAYGLSGQPRTLPKPSAASRSAAQQRNDAETAAGGGVFMGDGRPGTAGAGTPGSFAGGPAGAPAFPGQSGVVNVNSPAPGAVAGGGFGAGAPPAFGAVPTVPPGNPLVPATQGFGSAPAAPGTQAMPNGSVPAFGSAPAATGIGGMLPPAPNR